MRTTYRNGDPIQLVHSGCDGCSPAMINNVLCHEQGCPHAWKDEARECPECGNSFYSTHRHNVYCDECERGDEPAMDDSVGHYCPECDEEYMLPEGTEECPICGSDEIEEL